MPSGKGKTPQEFDLKKKAEAEFWAWLMDGYAVPADTRNAKAEPKILVLTKDTIKSAIHEALEEGNSQRAQELLDAASKPTEEFNKAIVRKSIRVGQGEYARLLYLKILERTSFADVLMKVLMSPCKRKVKELKHQYSRNQLYEGNKLDHLLNAIEQWEREKPKSRAAVAEWGDWRRTDYRTGKTTKDGESIPANVWDTTASFTGTVENKLYTSITPFYGQLLLDKKYLEKVKAAFRRFTLTDLTIRASGGDLSKPISGLFYEFKDELAQKIEEAPFVEQISLYAFSDNVSENQELFFGLYFLITTELDAKRELDLFSKYGEDKVIEFINRVKLYPFQPYKGITNSEQYKNWVASSPSDDTHQFDIIIGSEWDLTCCKISASAPDRFEMDWPPDMPSALENYRQQFEVLLQRVTERFGFENTHKEEPTYPRLAIAAGSLIPKAIDKASSPDDYRVINNLLTFKNLYYDYQTIIDFGERLTTSSLKHHSVVSFYINSDLWRLVPIVLKGTNWIKLADDYLEERKKIHSVAT